jgi:hypothetical protein
MHGLKQIATSQIYCCNSDIVDKVEKIGLVTEREKKKRAALRTECFNLKQQLIPHGVAYSYGHITLSQRTYFQLRLPCVADHLLTTRSVGGHGLQRLKAKPKFMGSP